MEVLFVEFGLQQSEEYVNPGEGGGGTPGNSCGAVPPVFHTRKGRNYFIITD